MKRIVIFCFCGLLAGSLPSPADDLTSSDGPSTNPTPYEIAVSMATDIQVVCSTNALLKSFTMTKLRKNRYPQPAVSIASTNGLKISIFHPRRPYSPKPVLYGGTEPEKTEWTYFRELKTQPTEFHIEISHTATGVYRKHDVLVAASNMVTQVVQAHGLSAKETNKVLDATSL
jgi:hypothetical protein